MYLKLTLLIMISFVQEGTSRIEFTNFKCESMDKSFAGFEYCVLKAVNRSYKYISTKVNLYKTPITSFKINFALYKRLSGYKPFLYNLTINGCQFLRTTNCNPVAKYFFDFVREITNVNHSCPYNHDVIVGNLSNEMINYRATNILHFPEGNYMFEIRLIVADIHRARTQLFLSFS